MGGNSRIIDRSTGNVIGSAEKIDLKIFQRSELTQRLLSLFFSINIEFWKKTGNFLWKNKDILSCKVFSGSSEFLFKGSIWDDDFLSCKPVIGDIDITFPREFYQEFAAMMQENEGKAFSPGIVYLGQDRNNFNTTFLSVFEYSSGLNKVRIQIDFESAIYENGSPSEWARFSHNSSWEDISSGLKGVHHKFLLINIVRSLSTRNDIVIATPTSTSRNVKLVSGKKTKSVPHTMAFSVDKGLREKYTLFHDNGNIIIYDDKIVMKEIPVEKSTYITDVASIFSYIFGNVPGQDELRDFYSFTGIVRLMKQKMNDEQIENTFKFALEENLFGKRAQILEKNNPEIDKAVKEIFVKKMVENFKFLQKYEVEINTMKAEYYNNFKFDKC